MLGYGQLDLLTERLAQLGKHVLRRIAWEQAAIEFHRDFAGDDVHFVATMEDGRADGVVEKRIKEFPGCAH